MSGEYRHIEQYAEDILRLKAQAKTRSEIGTKFRLQQRTNIPSSSLHLTMQPLINSLLFCRSSGWLVGFGILRGWRGFFLARRERAEQGGEQEQNQNCFFVRNSFLLVLFLFRKLIKIDLPNAA